MNTLHHTASKLHFPMVAECSNNDQLKIAKKIVWNRQNLNDQPIRLFFVWTFTKLLAPACPISWQNQKLPALTINFFLLWLLQNCSTVADYRARCGASARSAAAVWSAVRSSATGAAWRNTWTTSARWSRSFSVPTARIARAWTLSWSITSTRSTEITAVSLTCSRRRTWRTCSFDKWILWERGETRNCRECHVKNCTIYRWIVIYKIL